MLRKNEKKLNVYQRFVTFDVLRKVLVNKQLLRLFIFRFYCYLNVKDLNEYLFVEIFN